MSPTSALSAPDRQDGLSAGSGVAGAPPPAARLAALLLLVALAWLPWPGKWALLKTLLPLALVAVVVARRGTASWRLWLAPPPRPLRILGLAVGIGAAYYAWRMLVVNPLVSRLFSEPKDLSTFAAIKGSLGTLLVYLFFMWILAAIAEEVVWRGFVLTELGELLGGSRLAWATALGASAVAFGLCHLYQGPRGVFTATLAGLVFGGLFLWRGRRSLWLPILVHGFGNTISFILIYLDIYQRYRFLAG